jgi:hypothetical protein
MFLRKKKMQIVEKEDDEARVGVAAELMAV